MLHFLIKEKIIEGALFTCASLSILTTLGIIIVLVVQLFSFFQVVSVWDFLTDTQWTPLFDDKHFGIIALLSGTFLTTVIAIVIALPFGLVIAIFLSEYAKKRTRQILKPMLELLATVPTVVYGFFALTVVTPFLQKIFPGIAGFNALSPGIVMGLMIIPLITSLSEDAMYAVPRAVRDGAYALGSSTFQTAWKVVVPSASSGIIVSVILATSRAIGETMIVAIAAGQQPRLTLNPLVPIETVTTYIVQVSMGDVPHGSIEYQTIFAAGFSLFVFTFALNNLSFFIKKKYAQVYE